MWKDNENKLVSVVNLLNSFYLLFYYICTNNLAIISSMEILISSMIRTVYILRITSFFIFFCNSIFILLLFINNSRVRRSSFIPGTEILLDSSKVKLSSLIYFSLHNFLLVKNSLRSNLFYITNCIFFSFWCLCIIIFLLP